ncbi:LOW QUALITY PROTEIN: hypothetical protein Cgig2_034154 [Carnegiea gigantea]|uniref:Uncharacterized protein n=1 Tax=Carnegiea gigantea TaxID=171969 RepID=A0A9Q1Q6C2_9CARY|nr:LOW QUALITY PROTEIN: hypothetical protein Cgig2_034154 [Carnegiea gigantea]
MLSMTAGKRVMLEKNEGLSAKIMHNRIRMSNRIRKTKKMGLLGSQNRPNGYAISDEHMIEQLVHYHTVQLRISKQFFNTYVYGCNQESKRQQLGDGLHRIAQRERDLVYNWGFQLYLTRRIGTTEVLDCEIKNVNRRGEACELQGTRSCGAYFSWANKTFWCIIDGALVNIGLHVKCPFRSYFPLSALPSCHKRKPEFLFCDMWLLNPQYNDTISCHYHDLPIGCKMYRLKTLLCKLRHSLKQLNKDKCADIHAQQTISGDKLTRVQQQPQSDPNNDHLLTQ